MMFALIIASIQVSEPPSIPSGAVRPLLNYFACLGTQEARHEVPSGIDAREALTAVILADCADSRSEAAISTAQVLALDPAFNDSAVRQTAVENWLQYFDRGLRHRVVERERFVTEAQAHETCLDRGETNC